MAVDSAAKRASALYFIRHRKGRLIPDGTITGVDFLDAVGFYRGIAASAATGAAVIELEAVSVTQYGITPSVPQYGVTATVPQYGVTITRKNDLN